MPAISWLSLPVGGDHAVVSGPPLAGLRDGATRPEPHPFDGVVERLVGSGVTARDAAADRTSP